MSYPIIVLPPKKPSEYALSYLPKGGGLLEALQKDDTLRTIAEEIGISQQLQSDLTKRDYLRSLKRYIERNENQIPTVRIVEAYLESLKRQGLSLRYRRRELAAIRWWANRMLLIIAERTDLSGEYRKYVYENADMVSKIKDPRGELPKAGRAGHLISLEEFATLLQTISQDKCLAGVRDLAMFCISGLAGFRIGDTRNIQYDGVTRLDRDDLAYKISVRTKGSVIREVSPIEGVAAEYLSDWMTARGDAPGYLFTPITKGKRAHVVTAQDSKGREYCQHLSKEALRKIFLKRFTQAGIYKPKRTVLEDDTEKEKRGSTWHDLRRTLVSRLLDETHDLAMVSKFIKHAQTSTTAQYDIRPDSDLEQLASQQARNLDEMMAGKGGRKS